MSVQETKDKFIQYLNSYFEGDQERIKKEINLEKYLKVDSDGDLVYERWNKDRQIFVDLLPTSLDIATLASDESAPSFNNTITRWCCKSCYKDTSDVSSEQFKKMLDWFYYK